jgi:hypothetical protein|tara:strand:- start:1281 stop:2573 length:1293 start_codon:yes stop_codon:yes gene_type:complete
MINSNAKANPASWFRRVLFGPVSELIILTLFFGTFTFALFWLTIKFQLLPTELMRPDLSQEDTGLFDALGGWALGFAGAVVAIRIAGIAKNIQLNDSIREQIRLWEEHVERISDLNSRLTRSISDTKRACAAVLLYAKDLYITEQRAHLINPKPGRDGKVVKPHEAHAPEEMLQEKLEEKLEKLVETIEEAFKDSVFRSVLQFSVQADINRRSAPEKTHMKNYSESFFTSSKDREAVKRIVDDDNEFFDVLNVLSGLNQGARNFGIGLVELRAMGLIQHFRMDLMRLTEYQEDNQGDGEALEIADAAWLLLGLLLSRRKRENSSIGQNDGFIIIALLLGSLPTEKTMNDYLNSKFNQVVQTYSGEGSETMRREVDALSKRLYYVKGNELSELADLITKCSNNLSYLDVLTKSTGVSAAYESKKESGKQSG